MTRPRPDAPSRPSLPVPRVLARVLAPVLAVLLGAVPGALLLAAPPAAAATATTLTLTAPASAYALAQVDVTAGLTGADGRPLVGAELLFEQQVGGAWRPLGVRLTDGSGSATVQVHVYPKPANDRLRVRFAGTADLDPATAEARVAPLPRPTVVELDGPASVVDERAVRLRVRWRSDDGRPVAGKVVLRKRAGAGPWRRFDAVRTGADGTAELRVRPRRDTRWKAVGKAGKWWARDVSPVLRIDNVPPGQPVAYPAAAPRPRVALPRPPRAVGRGPNGVVRAIPGRVWRSMVGRSWHRGCPVGRPSLRLVRVNFWGYDGYRYRGELVVRVDVAVRAVHAFSELYRQRLPIRSMYRVDRFGWSRVLGGADNYRSMAAGNTSAFNCRGVVGSPGTLSPHATGRAIDVNTWENPYFSRTGVVPNRWWASRSHPRIAWRSSAHPVVRVMRAHGFAWTYGTVDSQHFDG